MTPARGIIGQLQPFPHHEGTVKMQQLLPFTSGKQYSHFQPRKDNRLTVMKGQFTLAGSTISTQA
jgi:hypothetical protein